MDGLWIFNIVLTFLLCCITAGVLIPQILLIAYRKQLFDEPDSRKIHKLPVPRLGGMAFTLVIFFTLALVFGVNMVAGYTEILSEIYDEITTVAFGFCAIMILYIVGIADDLIGVRYSAKFVVQILASIMIIVGGLYLSDLHGFMWIHEMPLWMAWPLTVLVAVFIINAINLIDGIDGLASGLCSVAFVTYGVTFFVAEEYIYAAIAFACLGVLLPFFYYNVFGKAENHKKIFMGDTGALTIGICICLCSFKILECIPDYSDFYPNAFVVAFAPLIIPCFDVIRVYILRVSNGKNPFLPDKNHIHHKFLAIGVKPRAAMSIIVLSSLGLVVLNCVASKWIDINILLLANVAIVTLGNVLLSKKIKQMGGGEY